MQNTPPTKSQLLAAALGYARRGIPVFPLHDLTTSACSCWKGEECEHAGKHPRTEHGHLDASTDPRKVHMWWSRWPRANIGIPTGERSGLLVVDQDPDRGGASSLDRLEAEKGLPPTLSASTGGGGLHLYYRYPAGEIIRNSAGKIAPGVDVRGEGGYVVAPPSCTKGAYRWAERREISEPPAWMAEELAGRTEPPARRSQRPTTTPAEITSSGGPIPQGQRNDVLFRLACSLRGRGLDEEEIRRALEGANEERCSPPIPGPELTKIAASAAKYPAGDRQGPKVAPREVLYALAKIEAEIWEADAAGEFAGSKSRRDVWISLLQLARKHGTTIPAGVRVSVSVRALAGGAGVAPSTAQTAIAQLREEGRIRRDDAGRGTGSGALVLVVPRGPGGPGGGPAKADESGEKSPCTESVHSATKDHPGGGSARSRSSVPISCSGAFSTFTAPRLRRSSPARKAGKRGTITYEDEDGREHVRVRESKPRPATPAQKRLGKSRGAIVDHLEVAGVLTYQELTERLCYARRDYVRRVLVRPLIETGVVKESTGGVELAEDWRVALESERKRTGETELSRRYKAHHRYERIIYLCRRMAWRRVPERRIALKLGITVEQVREITRPVVRVPTCEEQEAHGRELKAEQVDREERIYRAIMAHIGTRIGTVHGPAEVWDVKGGEVRVILDSDRSRWVSIAYDELTGEVA